MTGLDLTAATDPAAVARILGESGPDLVPIPEDGAGECETVAPAGRHCEHCGGIYFVSVGCTYCDPAAYDRFMSTVGAEVHETPEGIEQLMSDSSKAKQGYEDLGAPDFGPLFNLG